MDVIATLIALLAVVISVVALVRTRKFNARVLAIQEEQGKVAKLQRQNLEREEAQLTECKVRVHWYKGINNSDRVKVANVGAVDAYEVNIVFSSENGRDTPEMESEMKALFPIAQLHVGDDRNFLIAPTMSTGHRWPLTITWKNVEGSGYSFDTVLGG
jgi:hypothetical protein